MKKKHGLLVLSLILLAALAAGCGNVADTITTPINSTKTTTTSPAIIPIENQTDATIEARNAAEEFIKNSSTFKFDGIPGSIKIIKEDPGWVSAFISRAYTFTFETAHPGHGERTGLFLAQVITRHTAVVLVNLENNIILSAVCDNSWDMMNEKELPTTVCGLIVGISDTMTIDGPLDVPHTFTIKILKKDSTFTYVSYTAYPPSPVGDAAKEKISLDFHNGLIRTGDFMEARGVLNKDTNTINVRDQGDYIRTAIYRATVTGIVAAISDIPMPNRPQDVPREYVYELIRDDGTFINVSYTVYPPLSEWDAHKVTISLYNEEIKPGDYMKATGIYDKETNTILITGDGDTIKTYELKP